MSATTITIRLYATLQGYMPDNADHYPIQMGASLEHLIKSLEIPKDKIKLLFINGVRCGLETIVKDGDCIGIFPPIGGG